MHRKDYINMTTIDSLKKYLDEDIYNRENVNEVRAAFTRLGVNGSELLYNFYVNFAGPFWEETMGIELLDIVDDSPNIESITEDCRREFNFPHKYLILTRLSTNSVIVLDSETDKLYTVDFEGGDRALLSGTLEATWESFEDFLLEYFNLPE